MSLLDAIILGIVEGLTEFIPVSSTGHLILTSYLLGLDDSAVDSYLIVIQFGAIAAVAVYYRQRLAAIMRGVLGGDAAGRALAIRLGVAFVPAALVGLSLGGLIEDHLFSALTVGLALIVGGIIMMAVERPSIAPKVRKEKLEDISIADALVVGCIQCFALWPGMSRSMSTIVGGQLRGFSTSLAADFSFLLALPTLGAATVYMAIKEREALAALEGGLGVQAVGMVVSFFVAWAAVAWFLKVVKNVGMTPFGAYRIVVGLVVVGLVAAGRM